MGNAKLRGEKRKKLNELFQIIKLITLRRSGL